MPEDDSDFVADSEDEQLLVNAFPMKSTAASGSAQSLSTLTKPVANVSTPPSLSHPPIAVLPQASASSSSILSPPPPPQRAKPSKEKSTVAPPTTLVTAQSLKQPPTSASADASKPRARPKPRPAYKGAQANANDTGTGQPSVLSSISSFGVTNPAEPSRIPAIASMDDPITTSTAASTTTTSKGKGKHKAIEADVSDISTFSGDIADRAKMRSRAAKSSRPALRVDPADVIELTSDSDDELGLRPPPPIKYKSKSKSKADAEAGKEKSPSPPKRPRLGMPSDTEGPGSTMATIPMYQTSPQLPPSDLPLPSSAPSGPPLEPPTSTPVAGSSPPSSPIPVAPTRKRKRATVMVRDDDDDNAGGIAKKDSATLMPPPPLPEADTESARQPTASTSAHPETGASNTTSKPKPKSRKKTVGSDDDSDWAANSKQNPKGKKKAPVADESDSDDWEGNNKPKRKATKRNAKKNAAAESGEKTSGRRAAMTRKGKGKEIMEVVVELPMRSSRSPKKPVITLDAEGAPTVETASKEPDIAANGNVDTSSELSVLESDHEPTGAKATKGPGTACTNTKAIPNSPVPSKPRPKGKDAGKGKKRVIADSDEEDEILKNASPPRKSAKSRGKARADVEGEENQDEAAASPGLTRTGSLKENDFSKRPSSSPLDIEPEPPARVVSTPRPAASMSASTPSTRRASSIIPKTSSTPMSELIRRASSKPGSPFPSTSASASLSGSPRPSFSPFAKSSKSLLRRIAPLHPNRRTPPPPPPRPPPPKKSKKMLELEEKWEEELAESVEGWTAMSEHERAQLRRAKRDAELGFDD